MIFKVKTRALLNDTNQCSYFNFKYILRSINLKLCFNYSIFSHFAQCQFDSIISDNSIKISGITYMTAMYMQSSPFHSIIQANFTSV